MALFTGTPSGNVAAWSPIIISREMLRFRKAKLVLGSRVWNRSQDALSEGQRVSFPVEVEPTTNPVTADRTYTPTAYTGTVVSVDIDLFQESSFSVGVDADAQSKATKMLKDMKSRSYALAKYLEDYLWDLLDNGTVTQTDNVGAAITDKQLRRLARYLEDQDAMEEGDVYVAMGPADKDDIIGIDKYASVEFTGKAKGAAVTGEAPNIAGMVPLVTTRAGTDSNGRRRILAFQKRVVGLITQKKSPLAIQKWPLKTDYVSWILAGANILDVNLAAFARVG